MNEYRTWVNIGIKTDKGTTFYRINQLEENDATHLKELRSPDSIKREVLETFVNQMLRWSHVNYKFEVDRNKPIKGVEFEMMNYGSRRGE